MDQVVTGGESRFKVILEMLTKRPVRPMAREAAAEAVAALILVALSGIASSATAESHGRQWGFSRPAVSPCSEAGPLPISYAAPDGTKVLTVEVTNGNSRLYLTVAGARSPIDHAAGPCPELLWSSDSRAFFVNYSSGGRVGDHDVRVFHPSPNGVRTVDPTSSVRKDFLASYPKCFEPEDPNVAGVAWLDGSRRLLVAAEVLPHSNCDSMGTFAAYEVEFPSGKLLHKWSQLQAKTRFWRLLGHELRSADDVCIRRPQSCHIPALHGR